MNYQFRQSNVPNDDVLASADGDEPVGDTVQSDEHRVAVGVANYVEIAQRRVAQILFGQTHFELREKTKRKTERTRLSGRNAKNERASVDEIRQSVFDFTAKLSGRLPFARKNAMSNNVGVKARIVRRKLR